MARFCHSYFGPFRSSPRVMVKLTFLCFWVNSCSESFNFCFFSLTFVSKTFSISFSIFFIFNLCSLKIFLARKISGPVSDSRCPGRGTADTGEARTLYKPLFFFHLCDWTLSSKFWAHNIREFSCAEVFVVNHWGNIDQILKFSEIAFLRLPRTRPIGPRDGEDVDFLRRPVSDREPYLHMCSNKHIT